MRYERIIAAARQMPWAILPQKLYSIAEVLAKRGHDVEISADEIREVIGAQQQRQDRSRGGIAVIPVFGVISHRMDIITESSGGTSIESLQRNFRAALKNPDVSAILLDIDSPGGGVFGVDELSSEIFEARQQKPVFALANSLAASAAFWLGTAAQEFAAIPSADVGSVGVLAIHEDFSKAEEQLGIKTTVIHAGEFKAEGHPSFPLSEAATEAIQEQVDEHFNRFVRALARNRDTSEKAVKEDFGRGRVVSASKAVRAGMIDRVATFDQFLDRISSRVSRRPRAGAEAEPTPGIADDDRRRRLAARKRRLTARQKSA